MGLTGNVSAEEPNGMVKQLPTVGNYPPGGGTKRTGGFLELGTPVEAGTIVS